MKEMSFKEARGYVENDAAGYQEMMKQAFSQQFMTLLQGVVADMNNIQAKELTKVKAVYAKVYEDIGVSAKQASELASRYVKNIENTIRSGVKTTGNDLGFYAGRTANENQVNKVVTISNKQAKTNAFANQVRTEFRKDVVKQEETKHLKGIYKSLDTLYQFLFNKDSQEEGKERKKSRRFIDDLVDSLGKNKTLGAAIMDVVKLITYLGASYLSKFGTLGKVIAGALIVAGPSIIMALGKTLGRIIGNAILNLGKAFIGKILAPAAVKGAAGVAGNALPALALGTGAFFAGKAAVDAAKKGDKAGAWGFGVGAAGLGAGAIALLLAPLFPFLAPIATIAVVIGGIGVLVGKFHKEIGGILRKILEFLGIIVKDDEVDYHGQEYTKVNFGGKEYNAKPSLTPSGSNAKLTEYQWQLGNEGKLEHLGTGGYITNFSRLTTENAWNQMMAWKNQDKEGFEKRYQHIKSTDTFKDATGKEWKASELIDFDEFTTDLSNAEKGKKATEIILGRGALEDFLAKKVRMESMGIHGARITAGIGTMGNYSLLKATPHNLTGSERSHNVLSGLTYDVGFGRKMAYGSSETRKVGDILLKTGSDSHVLFEGDHFHVARKGFLPSLALEDKNRSKVEAGLMSTDEKLGLKINEIELEREEKLRQATEEKEKLEEQRSKFEKAGMPTWWVDKKLKEANEKVLSYTPMVTMNQDYSGNRALELTQAIANTSGGQTSVTPTGNY